MGSLNYAFEGREALFTSGAGLPVEDFITSRNMGFVEPNFPDDLSEKPVFVNRFLENSVEASDHPNGNMVSAKRPRNTDSKSQTPSCQVCGCNKDLSNSKDYHKRHRVCDVHSKTAVVIVNGIQQRFCQQCSRFHVLAEFDEGKRSCRKRLAGHNERRRKPQFNAHLFGATFGPDLSKTSLLFSGFFPSRFFGSEVVHGPMNDNMMSIKLENDEQAPQERSSISSCALSLLSSHPQSQNYASNESANRPLIFRQGQSLRKSRKRVLEKSTNHEGFSLVSNNDEKSSNSKHNCMPQESGNTVDLVELSLHLQRIEQQKHYEAQVQTQDM